MIDITKTTGIQTRFQEFNDKVNETATMRINIPKTVHMTIAPKITVTKTTEEDIIADQAAAYVDYYLTTKLAIVSI